MIDPALLSSLSLFHGAPPPVAATLAARAIERAYATGEVLFAAGSTPRGIHIVLEGRIRVLRGTGDRQHVVHSEGPGGTLGEVPTFAGGVYPATAVAAEPTRCLLVSREAIDAAVAACPAVAFLFLARLATRVRELVDRLDERSTRDATARLARFLLARARTPATPRVALGMTQGALAEELGTVREVVVRGLLSLRSRGAIKPLGGGRYEIVDAEKLRAAAD
jgi:CRP/FNR family transcriptional regulator, dissimilatory nitrate respiration regulator